MCIVFMCISDNPKLDGYKVIIAVNRDEFYNRPTKELDWWDDDPNIISGAAKNLKIGGFLIVLENGLNLDGAINSS